MTDFVRPGAVTLVAGTSHTPRQFGGAPALRVDPTGLEPVTCAALPIELRTLGVATGTASLTLHPLPLDPKRPAIRLWGV